MPGTTRYSATFDRPYEEDDRADSAPPANARRSRSLSWQAHSGLDGGRPYTPLGSRQPAPRSSSSDNGPSKATEHIPTRTVAKTTVKTHNNPFQFVKIGTCPLYKKAEEQLKKTKEVKKQDILKEEEEEWQTNLDSWKSRRRKMSEDVFRRQEEIRQFELEEQNNQAAQKKTKTFSEMVNSRATRGRALSLCLLTSPLDFQDWEFENKSLKNGSCSTFTDESEGNSTVNSEDEGVSMRGRLLHLDNQNNHTNGNAHIEQNSLKLETHNGNYNKLDLTVNNGQMKTKEGSYIDSGLESISSSHRAGDTPDSGSDFSQDSNSSIDCDSPRAGVNILEEFSPKSLQISPGQELNLSITLTDKAQEFGFSFQIDKDAGQVLISSVLEGSKAESSGVHLQDQITAIDGIDINSKSHAEITSMINKAKGKGKIALLLWRHNKITNGLDSIEKHVENSIKQNETESEDAKNQQYEKSIESENEMYVDDFEELQRQSELLKSNKTENTSTKSQALSNGNISATTNSSNKNSIKISAPVLKDTIENGVDDEKNKNNTDSNLSTENKKKNIIKVKRVRKKGVYSLDVSGTSNQIPQAAPVNCLYPLSPVTELPSPADETKTMSSSLSSNPSTPESNSEKENISKKILKADIQLNSSLMEKNKTAAASKSDVSKTAVPCDKLKFSSLNEVENKMECSNVPSSPTMSTAKDSKLSLENSQEEKAKVPSSPKKLKIKVKKANMSTEQKSPESSPTVKDVVLNSSGTKILDSPVDKKVTIGIKLNKKISSDSNSKDNQVNAIKNEKVESSDKKESNVVASEANVIASDAKSSLKDSSSSVATISSAKARNLSLKIGTKDENVSLPTASNVKPPKTPTDEKSKPMKSKKEKTNFKGSIILSSENTDTSSEVKLVCPKEKPETCDADKNLMAKTNKLDLSGCKNEASTIAKIEQIQTTIEEKSKPTTVPENKIKLKAEAKNKLSSDVTKVVEDLANSCTSPVKKEVSTAISEPKGSTTTTSNDNDSSELSTVMVNTSETVKVLPKGKSSLNVKTDNIGSDVSSDKVSDLSAKIESNIETEKLIPVSLAAKSKLPETSEEIKVNEPVSVKKEKTAFKENILSTKTIVNSEEAKETSVCNDTASSEKTKKLSLTIDTPKESLDKPTSPTVEKTKSPKTPQDVKSKPSFSRKKDPMKSKGDNIQLSGTPSVVQENGKSSLKEEPKIVDIKDSANLLLKTDILNESLILEQQQQGTTSYDNDSSKLSTVMVNTSETVKVLSKGKSSLKVKTANVHSDVSSDKVSDISAKIESNIETEKLIPVSLVAKSKPPKTSEEENVNKPVSVKKEKTAFKENILSTKTIVNSEETKETSVCNDTASTEKTKKLSLTIDTPKESLDKPTSPTVEKTKSPKTPQDKSKPSFSRKKDPMKSKVDNIQVSGTSAVVQENGKSSLKEESKIVDIKDSANLLLTTDVLNESLILEQQQQKQGTATSYDNDSSKLSTLMVNTSETVKVIPKGKSSLKVKTANIGSDVSSDKVSNLSAKNESKIETDKLIPVSLATKSKLLKTSKDEKVNESVSEKKENPKFKENILSTKTIVNAEDAKEASVCNDTASSEKTKKLSLIIDAPKESLDKSASPTVEKTKSPKTPKDVKSKPSFGCKKDQTKSKGDNIQQSGTSAVLQENGQSSLKEESKVVDMKDSGNLLLKIDVSNESLSLDGTVQTGCMKQPKTPQDEKPKPKLVRKRSKPKAKNKEAATSEKSQVNESSTSSVLPSSPTNCLCIPSERNDKSKAGPLVEDTSIKDSNEKMVSSQKRESYVMSSENSIAPASSESIELKENFEESVSASCNKNKNFTLKISESTATIPAVSTTTSSKQEKTPTAEKQKPTLVRRKSKPKAKASEKKSTNQSEVNMESSNSSEPHVSTAKSLAPGNESQEDKKSELAVNILLDSPAETAAVVPDLKSTSSKVETSQTNSSYATSITKNLVLKIESQNQCVDTPLTCSSTNAKKPKTPTKEKSKPFTQKKPNEKTKDSPTETAAVVPDLKCTTSKFETSETNSSFATSITKNLVLKIESQNQTVDTPLTCSSTNAKKPKTPTKEKSKPFTQKKQNEKTKDSPTETDTAVPDLKSSSSKVETSQTNSSYATSITKNLVLKIEPQNQCADTSVTCSSNNAKKPKTPTKEKSKPFTQKRLNEKIKDSPTETAAVVPDLKSSSKVETSQTDSSYLTSITKNLVLKFESQNQCAPVTCTSTKAKKPKTPTKEKSKPFTQKKQKVKDSPTESTAVLPDLKVETSETNVSIAANETRNLIIKIESENPCVDTPVTCTNTNAEKPKTPTKGKSKPFTLKKQNEKIENINSQNVIAPAKQNEDNLNSNIESLNIVFQSEPKNTLAKNQPNNIVSIETKSNQKIESDLVPDILPVEKVAEEMEKLILEQLEEEERAKELATEIKCSVGTSEQLLIAPPKLAEPPKEKPPPPPTATEGNQKETSLKRVNSTKRIKKEIHKRRSNFLGIDSADESLICGESSVPPPPALEEILKAEMELDRQSRLKIENASTERLTLEEKEIMEKEREIIETLESEERMKNLINGTEMYNDASPSSSSDMTYEGDCIFSMKNERKRIEDEHMLPEEQQLNFLEENQLREREEFIRKQEAGNSIQSIADPSFSVAADASNKSQSALSSLTDKHSKVSLSDSNGDGKNNSSNSSMAVSENKSSDCGKKVVASEKPAVPPKPLKKKEAIRKERERLRQEQEALQREREEHRRKLMLEQEELKKQQKSHAPDASVSRLGPIPSLIPPNYPSQLTTTTNATPNARESASFPSRSHHGDTNGVAGSINSVELIGPSVVRQSKMPAPRKAVQNEAWGQQKMPSVRKQNQDSLTESRYNQNHWLIQEAEMRRIAELKERQQRVSQLPCSQTHLAEDDVCSNPPRVPVIPPPHNPHVNYAAVQDKMWNYGQTNLPSKKYPPAVAKDLLHTVYPRETVSQQAPTKPSRVVPLERQEQMLSVSGRKRCSHCNEELGRGAAMIIESLQLYYHIHCFQCCVCQAQLGNGSCGTDVRVRNNKLHCHNCYSNDEAGLKFSQV